MSRPRMRRMRLGSRTGLGVGVVVGSTVVVGDGAFVGVGGGVGFRAEAGVAVGVTDGGCVAVKVVAGASIPGRGVSAESQPLNARTGGAQQYSQRGWPIDDASDVTTYKSRCRLHIGSLPFMETPIGWSLCR